MQGTYCIVKEDQEGGRPNAEEARVGGEADSREATGTSNSSWRLEIQVNYCQELPCLLSKHCLLPGLTDTFGLRAESSFSASRFSSWFYKGDQRAKGLDFPAVLTLKNWRQVYLSMRMSYRLQNPGVLPRTDFCFGDKCTFKYKYLCTGWKMKNKRKKIAFFLNKISCSGKVSLSKGTRASSPACDLAITWSGIACFTRTSVCKLLQPWALSPWWWTR